MRKVKSFSVDDVEDIDILDKLESCSNVSEYIKKLIRDDLNKNHDEFTSSQIEAIKKIVSKMIKGKVIDDSEEKNEMDKEVNDIINNPQAMKALMSFDNI